MGPATPPELDGQGDLLDDLDPETFQAYDFARVVGQEADAAEAEVDQDLGTDAGFVLQGAGQDGLPGLEEDQGSGAGGGDLVESAADDGVSGDGVEQVAIAAVDADEGVVAAGGVIEYERGVGALIGGA